jgi:hypothetical protein
MIPTALGVTGAQNPFYLPLPIGRERHRAESERF